MPRIPTWRVRVTRATEEWIDVEAETAEQAEAAAAGIPRVIGVFPRSAMRGELPVGIKRSIGIVEDE